MGGDLFDLFEGKRNKQHNGYYQKDRHSRDDEHNNAQGTFDNHHNRHPTDKNYFKSHDNQQHEDANRYYQSGKHENIGQQIMSMLMANKKLLIAAIISGIVLLVVIIFILMSLLSMILPIIENITKNGLKGVFDSALPIINKILSGAGK